MPAEIEPDRVHMRADSKLVADYVARKRAIISSGVTDSVDYSIEKGDFIKSSGAPSLTRRTRLFRLPFRRRLSPAF